MKNIRLPSTLLFLCVFVGLPFMPAHAVGVPIGTPCYVDELDNPGGPCASDAGIASVIQTISNFGQAILDAMDHHITQPISDQENANARVNDQQKLTSEYQAATKEAAQKNGEAAYQAIMKYTPTPADCLRDTNQIIRNYNYSQGVSRQQSLNLVSLNTTNLKNGITGGQYGATSSVASNMQTAMKAAANGGSLSTSQIANVPDKLIVEQQCANQGSNGPACYNGWVENQIKNNMNVSNGDKAPWNAQLNPQMAAYFVQRAQWENSRSAALETVNKFLPKLYKTMDYYKQASSDYASAYGIPATGSGDSGQTRLNAQYPYASSIGLDHYEFEEAEFNAMMAMKDGASISATPGNITLEQTPEQRNNASQVIQAAAAQMQIAKMEKEELNGALKTLGVSPPSPSASAVSVTGSTATK